MWWQVLERGCRIWLTPPPFDHSKLLIVDNHFALHGRTGFASHVFTLIRAAPIRAALRISSNLQGRPERVFQFGHRQLIAGGEYELTANKFQIWTWNVAGRIPF